MPDRPPEILVLGGGPAGCAAARLLALWGHRVVLVTKPPASSHLPESIPPSAGKLFDLLGIRAAIDRAGFVRTTGNTVWWGSSEPRVEVFADGARGWQVTGSQLEPILQAAVSDAGVSVEHDRWTIIQAKACSAAFILDCTGRTGLLARAMGWRVLESSNRTVALIGRWKADRPFDVPDRTHTLIESYANGWAWSVPGSGAGPQAPGLGSQAPAPGRDRYISVMVDPRTSDLAHGKAARDVYEAEIAKTKALAALVRDATLTDGPAGWDASMYSSAQYADEHVLLVGDAGSFIDPLSSIGVKKALASGWLAAVATHTALIRPAMRQVAFDFFAAREAEIYAAFRTLTGQYLADAATAHSHPFWSDRAEPDAHEMSLPTAAVQRAFDRVRHAKSLALQRAPGLCVEDRPAVAGAEIVMEARLVTAAEPAGLRYLFDVDVLALIDLAPAHSQAPDLFEAYNRHHAPVPLPDFLAALATAVARGYLILEEPVAGGE